jgi:hypothetical protein
MSVTLRGRVVSFDNVAAGNTSGTERTIAGSAPPAQKVGGLDNPTSGSAFPTANIADNIVSGTITPTREIGAD